MYLSASCLFRASKAGFLSTNRLFRSSKAGFMLCTSMHRLPAEEIACVSIQFYTSSTLSQAFIFGTLSERRAVRGEEGGNGSTGTARGTMAWSNLDDL